MDLVRILSFTIGFCILSAVVLLIRQRRLKEKFSLLWLFSSTIICLLSISRSFVETIGLSLGFLYPPSLLFLLGTLFLLVINISFSVTLSELSCKIDILAQRLALLEGNMERALADKTPALPLKARTIEDPSPNSLASSRPQLS